MHHTKTTSKVRGRVRYGAPTEKRDRRDVTELAEVKEITILNLNIRGLNSAAKQVAIDNVVKQVDPNVICLNETKLQYDLYLDNFWSQRCIGGMVVAGQLHQPRLVSHLSRHFATTFVGQD